MSRLAKKPIIVPKGTEVNVSGRIVSAKGKLGNSEITVPNGIALDLKDDELSLAFAKDNKLEKPFLGLYWALVNNLVKGVTEGFLKKLTLVGVGYRAALQEKKLSLKVGYSHPTDMDIPDDLEVKVENNGTEIQIRGKDKQKVGQFAANVRMMRKPEPYKGKGIRYHDEEVRRKAGKSKGK